jgi:hypothetical protein
VTRPPCRPCSRPSSPRQLSTGIDYAVEKKDRWVAERKLIDAAIEFNKAVWAYEEFEGIDWVDLQRFHEKFDEAVKACQKY